jgi:hypothetical protein
MAEFAEVSQPQQAQLQEPFAALQRTIERQVLIAVIRDTLRRFDEVEYQNLLRQMTKWAQPPVVVSNDEGFDGEPAVAEPRVEYEIVSRNTLGVPFNKALLTNEKDVDEYTAALKRALLQAIQEGKRIQI